MTTTSNVKRPDKLFSEKDSASDIVDDNSISACPLVKSLQESSNIHKIQEYEERDMAEQFQN